MSTLWAVWRVVRGAPGWVWGVLATALGALGLYLRGRRDADRRNERERRAQAHDALVRDQQRDSALDQHQREVLREADTRRATADARRPTGPGSGDDSELAEALRRATEKKR